MRNDDQSLPEISHQHPNEKLFPYGGGYQQRFINPLRLLKGATELPSRGRIPSNGGQLQDILLWGKLEDETRWHVNVVIGMEQKQIEPYVDGVADLGL